MLTRFTRRLTSTLARASLLGLKIQALLVGWLIRLVWSSSVLPCSLIISDVAFFLFFIQSLKKWAVDFIIVLFTAAYICLLMFRLLAYKVCMSLFSVISLFLNDRCEWAVKASAHFSSCSDDQKQKLCLSWAWRTGPLILTTWDMASRLFLAYFFRTGRIFFQRNLATLTTAYLDAASSQEVNGTIEKTPVLLTLLHLTWIYCG